MKMECVLSFCTHLSEKFLVLRGIQRDTITNYVGLQVNHLLFCLDIKESLI